MGLLKIKFFNHFNNNQSASAVFSDVIDRLHLVYEKINHSKKLIEEENLYELIVNVETQDNKDLDFISIEDICLSFELHCRFEDFTGKVKSFFYDEIDGWIEN